MDRYVRCGNSTVFDAVGSHLGQGGEKRTLGYNPSGLEADVSPSFSPTVSTWHLRARSARSSRISMSWNFLERADPFLNRSESHIGTE